MKEDMKVSTTESQTILTTMDITEVFQYLPQRYPFLMIDRVGELIKGKSIKAYKNVSFNEPHFQGHFPNIPIMPGVLLIEAMAQAVGILAFKTADKKPDSQSIYLLVGVDKARFKYQVTPGDQIEIYAEALNNKQGIWRFKSEIRIVGSQHKVCSAEIICAERKS